MGNFFCYFIINAHEPGLSHPLPLTSTMETNEKKLLLFCLHPLLSEETKRTITQVITRGIHWEHFLELALFSDVAPLPLRNILQLDSSLPIPRDSIQACLNYAKRQYTTHTLALWEAFKRIVTDAQQKNIHIMIIKGLVIDELLYKQLGTRNTSDIDIIIKKEDLQLFEDILINAGYSFYTWGNAPREHEVSFNQHLVFLKKGADGQLISWNLHTDILATPLAIKDLIHDCWHNAITTHLSGISALTLPLEETLIICLVEFYKDITMERRLLIKRLLDIWLMLFYYSHEIDWEKCILRLEKYRIKPLAYCAFLLTKHLFGDIPVYAHLVPRTRPSLIKKIIIGRFINSFQALHDPSPVERRFSLLFFSELILRSDSGRNFITRFIQVNYPRTFWLKGRDRLLNILDETYAAICGIIARLIRNLFTWKTHRK